MGPDPVTPVVIIVRSMYCGSHPPLVVILIAWNAPVSLSNSLRNKTLYKMVLAGSVHFSNPAVMSVAEVVGIGLADSLVVPPQEDTGHRVTMVTKMPAVRAVVGVLSKGC